MTAKTILNQMELVRTINSSFLKLRANLNIPLSQPLLDFAFGGRDRGSQIYLDKDHINLLGEAINIHDTGKEYSDMDWYYGFDVVKPENSGVEEWEILEENGYWVALNVKIPKWLKDKYLERRAERKKLFKLNKKDK